MRNIMLNKCQCKNLENSTLTYVRASSLILHPSLDQIDGINGSGATGSSN
jgi:hypothetical protein